MKENGHDQEASGGDQEVVECRCECCAMEEECTKAYMRQVRAEHYGRWVCGLCAEAVEEGNRRRRRSPEEALQAHMTECMRFNHNSATIVAPSNTSPVALLAAAMTRILRRSFSNAASAASLAASPSPNDSARVVSRSSTCISSLPRHCSTAL